MTQTRLKTGTRGLLAGEPVGSGNVWERPGLEGVSVRLGFEDRHEIVAVGDTFQAGGVDHRLVAIEFDGPTARHVLVIESLDTPAPHPVLEDAPAETASDEAEPPNKRPVVEDAASMHAMKRQLARRYPEFTHAIHVRSADELREQFQALTPSILSALGADLEAVSWTQSSRESYVDAGRGERLGPNTTDDYLAVLDTPLNARADVTVNATRWSEISISDITVSGLWMVGDLDAWIRGTSRGDDQIRDLVFRASDTITDLVLEVLRTPTP